MNLCFPGVVFFSSDPGVCFLFGAGKSASLVLIASKHIDSTKDLVISTESVLPVPFLGFVSRDDSVDGELTLSVRTGGAAAPPKGLLKLTLGENPRRFPPNRPNPPRTCGDSFMPSFALLSPGAPKTPPFGGGGGKLGNCDRCADGAASQF